LFNILILLTRGGGYNVEVGAGGIVEAFGIVVAVAATAGISGVAVCW